MKNHVDLIFEVLGIKPKNKDGSICSKAELEERLKARLEACDTKEVEQILGMFTGDGSVGRTLPRYALRGRRHDDG